jgi:transposase
MGRKVKKVKNYSTEQIETLIASDANHRLGVKLFAILQVSRGYSSRELADFFGTSFKQICNWVDRFDAEGIGGLSIKRGRGRRFRLTDEQRNRLKEDLIKSPKNFGYKSSSWSGTLIGAHLKKSYQIDYKQSAIYYLMRKIGFSFNV